MNKITYLLGVIRSPRKIFQALSYVTNDEVFWDSYVRDWRKTNKNKGFTYLGNEWSNEGIFLTLLQKYSSLSSVALEIGCGGGRITSRASELFQHVHAADISTEMLRQCRRSVLNSNVSYHKLDGFTLGDFGDSSVDVVFSHDVFVHFSSLQVYPYLWEIKRILQKGGVGLISFYSFRNSFDLYKRMAFKFCGQRRFPPHMRVHFVNKEMIEQMFYDLGLQLIEIEETNFLIIAFRK